MDGPPRKLLCALFAVLVVVSGPVVATGGATPGSLFGVQSVDPDQVVLRIDLQEDGDAQWRVEYRVRLDSENETEAFKDLQNDVEQNESAYLMDFKSRINDTVDAAENSTGRTMVASNYNVSARITQLPQEYGVLTYTFTWSNFAVVDGDRLIAGDALAGFFLDSETTLAFGWPEDYQSVQVSPEPTDRQTNAVLWRGPLDFGDGEPTLVVEPGTGSDTTTDDGTTDGSGGNGATTTDGTGEQGIGLGTIAGVLGLLVVLAGLGFVYVRRNGFPGGDTTGTTPAGGPSDGGDRPGAGATSDAGTESGGEDQPPAELLSNEERVEHFLEQQGGRAKQQEIVDGLEWTDAKTSQVLSGMASEGDIEKFRIGRENVVKLPDDDEDDDSIEI